MRTIAHVYDSYAEASRVVSSLEAAGVPQDDISVVSGDKAAAGGTASGMTSGPSEAAASDETPTASAGSSRSSTPSAEPDGAAGYWSRSSLPR